MCLICYHPNFTLKIIFVECHVRFTDKYQLLANPICYLFLRYSNLVSNHNLHVSSSGIFSDDNVSPLGPNSYRQYWTKRRRGGNYLHVSGVVRPTRAGRHCYADVSGRDLHTKLISVNKLHYNFGAHSFWYDFGFWKSFENIWR